MEIADEYKFDPKDLKLYMKHKVHGKWFIDNKVEMQQIRDRYYNLKKKPSAKKQRNN
jgi:hypothetical protein